MHTINNEISSVEIIKHTGDLEINGNVSGEIILTDGNLTINGNVEDGARISVDNSITLEQKFSQLLYPTSGASVRVGKTKGNVICSSIGGNASVVNTGSINGGIHCSSVGGNATVKSSGTIYGNVTACSFNPSFLFPANNTNNTVKTITINGFIGNNLKIKAKNSKCKITGNIGSNCNINADLGVSAKDIGPKSKVYAKHGKVEADTVYDKSKIIGNKGIIIRTYVAKNTKLLAANGKISKPKNAPCPELPVVNTEIKNHELRPYTDIADALKAKGLDENSVEKYFPMESHSNFYCPISSEFMLDPVTLARKGAKHITYNRSSIEDALLLRPNIDPMTNEQMSDYYLTNNYELREMMEKSINNIELSNANKLKI